MSISNSRTRRAEPRTAKDLDARGYKTLVLSSHTERKNGRRIRHVTYKVVGLDHNAYDYYSKVYGVIDGPPHKSRAYPRLKSGSIARRALPVEFESRVAAAHAILDHLGL